MAGHGEYGSHCHHHGQDPNSKLFGKQPHAAAASASCADAAARGKSSSSEMAHRAIVGKICPDANFEGVDGAPGCTLRSLGDGKRTIVLEWYGHH